MWGLIRLIEVITKFFGYVGAWLFALLALAMVWEVFSRYVLDTPTFWAYELAYMFMGSAFMFGIAYTMQMRRHVRVDFLYDSLAPKTQATIDFVGFTFMVLPMTIWCTYGLWDYLVYAYVNQEVSGESAWNPLVWPFRVTFVIGFALLVMQTVAEIIKCVYVWLGHDIPVPEGIQ